MTCIVGVETKTSVIIGGDSASTSGSSTILRREPKVFRNGAYLIGGTSSWRMLQLLQYDLTPDDPPDVDDLMPFMVIHFIDQVRQCLLTHGFSKVELNQNTGGVFMVGVRNQLFLVDDDFNIGKCVDGFETCGSGEEISRGIMWATTGLMEPRARVEMALTGAARYCTGVAPPFTILSTMDED